MSPFSFPRRATLFLKANKTKLMKSCSVAKIHCTPGLPARNCPLLLSQLFPLPAPRWSGKTLSIFLSWLGEERKKNYHPIRVAPAETEESDGPHFWQCKRRRGARLLPNNSACDCVQLRKAVTAVTPGWPTTCRYCVGSVSSTMNTRNPVSILYLNPSSASDFRRPPQQEYATVRGMTKSFHFFLLLLLLALSSGFRTQSKMYSRRCRQGVI